MNNDDIAILAADLMQSQDPDLEDWADADEYDRRLLIRDYRDDFASDSNPHLADARLTPELADAIYDEMMRRTP